MKKHILSIPRKIFEFFSKVHTLSSEDKALSNPNNHTFMQYNKNQVSYQFERNYDPIFPFPMRNEKFKTTPTLRKLKMNVEIPTTL